MKDYKVIFMYDGRIEVKVSAKDADTAINMARDIYDMNVETINDDEENITLSNTYKGSIVTEVEKVL